MDVVTQEAGIQAAIQVLEFWFGELDADGHADAVHARRWYSKDEAFDTLLRERFLPLHQCVAGGQCEHWLETAAGLLAYVIVLDQFSRNMFRGTARSFALDEQALTAAQRGVAAKMDFALAADQRQFLYLPFMHSEDPLMQDCCVEFYQQWLLRAPPGQHRRLQSGLDYAQRHRDIITRFGRFPHRNAALGRLSTAQELAFLQTPGSSF